MSHTHIVTSGIVGTGRPQLAWAATANRVAHPPHLGADVAGDDRDGGRIILFTGGLTHPIQVVPVRMGLDRVGGKFN
jgi:hypothetical protein